MNKENLHEIIRRYEAQYIEINNKENDEIFKWKAVACFQREWFSPENQKLSFSELFSKAKKETSVLIDNKSVSPANGIVKMAKKENDEVKRLFCEVLFADDGGDLLIRQQNMDCFLDGIEKIRTKYFPANWKYRQNRNSASCYLSLYAPEKNYIYKYTHAEAFAKYIEFGKDIGSGNTFCLANYYEMCDLIVEALDSHKNLLEANKKLLNSDDYYFDSSLHLIAFDIIYCASTYNLFNGLQHKAKKDAIKLYTFEKLRQEEAAKLQAQIDEIENKIQELEIQLDTYRNINLIGVHVSEKRYGDGVIIWQDVNNIKVQFGDTVKTYIIHKRFAWRPKFEDDAEIVAAMTEYEAIKETQKMLYKQLDMLLKK